MYYKDTLIIDKSNNNTHWQTAIQLELDNIDAHCTFHDLGSGTPLPSGYHNIRVHFVFDVKEDGCRKARLVAGGHLTPIPYESVYSSVAALCSLCIAIFIGELNGLHLMSGDIGYACLNSYTKENVGFVAGPEFGPLAGHTMTIDKAIYGLCSSGACYHERFAETMRDMGITPSPADPDVWMHDAGDVYKYLVVYVDDLIAIMKDHKAFFDELQRSPHSYTFNGLTEPRYHLGADYFHDKDGTLCFGAQTYVKRLLTNFESLYRELPCKEKSPLAKNDHPELDTSDVCTPDDIAKFHSIIGACQWMITLCCSDIDQAIMSLNRFHQSPRIGHVEHFIRIIGYIHHFPHAAIHFCTGIPDHQTIFGDTPITHEWMHTIYGNVTEDIPPDMPTPKGHPVHLTTFVDANLMHDLVTGRSCSGILHFLNQTPIDWFTKHQKQVETATYGSDFMAARQAIEQIMDLRYMLRMFGVPLDGPSWLFGDNCSVVTSSTLPHSTLGKCWNALSYHHCHVGVMAGLVHFEYIPSKQNTADYLTKNLPHYEAWAHLMSLLFWKGETQA